MTTEFLTPQRHNPQGYLHDPYTVSGARSILRRFRDDVIAMLDVMQENRLRYETGKTILATSPLAKKVYVAAAMKTMGLVAEQPTPNGTCALVLTLKAIAEVKNLKAYL